MHNSCMVHAACTLNRRQLYWQQWRLLRNNWHSRLYRSQRHHMSSPVADRDAGGIARKQMGWTQRGNTEVSFWTINGLTPQQHCTAPRGIPDWHNNKNLWYTQKMECCTMTIMLAYKSIVQQKASIDFSTDPGHLAAIGSNSTCALIKLIHQARLNLICLIEWSI